MSFDVPAYHDFYAMHDAAHYQSLPVDCRFDLLCGHNHSVTFESDFLNPWSAQLQAQQLAYECLSNDAQSAMRDVSELRTTRLTCSQKQYPHVFDRWCDAVTIASSTPEQPIGTSLTSIVVDLLDYSHVADPNGNDQCKAQTLSSHGYMENSLRNADDRSTPCFKSRLLDQRNSDAAIHAEDHLSEEQAEREAAPVDVTLLSFEDSEQLNYLLDSLREASASEIVLVSYGLYAASVGTRRATAPPDENSIRAAIFEMWADYFVGEARAALHMVRPQEFLANVEIHFIIEFGNRVTPLPRGDIPILRRTTWHEVWHDAEPVASYVSQNLSPQEVIIQCGLSEWCNVHTRTTCNLHVEKRICLPLVQVQLSPGSLVEIFIHFNPVEEEDVTSLFQPSEVAGNIKYRTWPEPNDEFQRLLQEADEEEPDIVAPLVGPVILDDPNEWTRLAVALEQPNLAQTQVVVHGLFHEEVGVRRIAISSFSARSIEEAMQGLWPELDYLNKVIYLVRPQPLQGHLNEVTIILEFYDPWMARDPSIKPVLLECLQPGLDVIHRSAQYSPERVTKESFPIEPSPCSIESNSLRVQIWIRDQPLMSYQECAVHAGNLVTIRYISQDSSIEDWVQHFFPEAQNYKTRTSDATTFELISITSWTFLEKVQPGEPSRRYTHYPPWLRFHDPYFVVQAFLEMMTQQQTGYDNYRVYVGQSQLGNQITFLCGEPRQHFCLVQVSFSAKWDDTWSETFCYQVKERQTTEEFLRSINVEGADIAIFREGRPFRDNVAHFRNGDLIEIEFEQCSDENGTTSGEDVQGHDDVSTMQHVQSHSVMSRHDEVKLKGRTCKPNPALGVDFDDELPFRRRVINDETIITRDVPPPNWAELPIYMVASSLQAVARDGAGHLFVYFRTWLLHHNQDSPVEPRDGRIRAQLMVNLHSHIRRLWREHIGPDDEIKTTVVRPNPVLDRNEGPMLLLLVECNRPLGSPTRPILLTFQEIDARGPEPNRLWRAFLAPPTINLQYLADRCLCEPHHIIAPLGTEDRRWIGQGQSRPVVSGRYIPIWFDLRRPPFGRNEPVDGAGTIMEDDSSLMQKGGGREYSRSPRRMDKSTPTSTQSSSIPFIIHAYRISREHRVISLDRASPQSLSEQVTRQWAAPSHQGVLDLHIVNFPPNDLDTTADATYIVEFAPDRQRQADPADRLILVDIKLQESSPQVMGSHLRRVLWTRCFMSREDMLHLLSADGVCKLTTVQCEVEVNHNLWPIDDSVRRQMLHGDFVQLKIRGPDAVPSSHIQIALCEKEAADSQRFVYHASPTPSPEPTTPAEEADSAGAHNSGQERPSLESEEEEVSPSRSLSMLQRTAKVQKNVRQQPLRDITNISCVKSNWSEVSEVSGIVSQPGMVHSSGLPHVSDRWCAKPGACNVSDGLAGHSEPKDWQSSDRPILRLDDHIESPVWLRIPCDKVQFLAQQMQGQQLGQVGGIDQVVKWHSSTQDACAQMPWWTVEIPLRYNFYTDGSSIRSEQGRQGASAIVLIIDTPQGARWGGSRVFSVGDDPTSPKTEVAAIVAGLVWCLQLGNQHPHHLAKFEVLFGYDCLMAGHTAAGQWKMGAHVTLQTHGRGLVLWIEQRFHINICWMHIKSHNGHPWNEAADALSWAAVHQWIDAPQFDDILALMDIERGSLTAWLWLIEASQQRCPGLPMLNGNNMQVNLRSPHQAQPDETHSFVTRQQKESPHCARIPTKVTINFCTANVLTLFPNEKGCGNFISARQEAIMKQMWEEQLNIIGIQESRCGFTGHRESEYFHILSASSTTKGTGGVQLWIAKRFKFPHRTLRVTSSNMKILHGSARRLVVRIETRWLRAIVVVCHAPSSSSYETADAYWTATTSAIPTKYQSWPTIYLCDANARVGSICSPSVDAWGADKENEAGSAFHHWLRLHRIVLPQTFEQHHSGPHHTWTHGGGASARIDFIAIDEGLMNDKVCTWVNERIDITTKREDHQCVCAAIDWTIWDCENSPAHGRGDTNANQSTVNPTVDWSCNVHNHAAHLQSWLQQQQPPKPRMTPRKAHLQPNTWSLILAKRYHWKRIRQVQGSLRTGWLAAVFKAWKGGTVTVSNKNFAPWLRLGDFSIAWHYGQYKRLANQVTVHVRQDDRQFYESLAEGQVAALADEGMPGLWRQIRALLPKQRSKLKTSIRCTGPDPAEIQKHFCQLEAGEQVDYQDLLRQCKLHQALQVEEAPLVMTLDQIPTRIQMEQLVLKQHPKKAPGLDGVMSETLKATTKQSSLPLYQLYFKSWVLGAEPVQFKGGMVHCLAKKGGSKEAHKMRGIMLLETAGKIFHGLARSQLLRWSLPRRLECQFGGFPHQQTLYATQLLRATTRVFKHFGMSGGVLFVDVKAAFHSLLRALTFGGQQTWPQALVSQLRNDGINIDQIVESQSRMSEEFCNTAPLPLSRMMQDMHEHTWFTLSQHDAVYRTHRGSRPGSPLADLAYNTMMRSVLARLQAKLSELPALQVAKAHIGIDCPPIAWVDDVAIPFVASTVHELDMMALAILECTTQVFAEFGLTLNQDKGKTEAVLQYRGNGSGPKIETTFIDNMGHLANADNTLRLRIVTDYSYLGTMYAQSASIDREIHTRVGKAQFAFRQLRRGIFCNRRLPVSTRVTLLNSLVVSIVLHGAGNWYLLSTKVFNQLAHTLTGWHRSILGTGFWSDNNVDDNELLASVGVLPLAVRLAKMRLLYAFQWIRHAPQVAVDVVTAEDRDSKSWLEAIRQAIKWFRSMRPQEDEAPPRTTEDTISWIVANVQQGAVQVRRAARRFAEQQKMMSYVIQGHRRIHQWSSGQGFVEGDVPAPTEFPGEYSCDLCPRKFHSAQALNGHRWKWHNQISEERRYIYDDTCRICGKCWWTPQRLQQHLKYSRKFPDGCFAQLRKYYEPVDAPAQFRKPESLASVYRLPKCDVAGPHYRPALPVWRQRQNERRDELHQQGQARNYVYELDPECQQKANVALQEATYRWSAEHDVEDGDALVSLWHDALPWGDITTENEGLTALFQWGRRSMYDYIQDRFGDDPDRLVAIERIFLEIAEGEPLWTWMSTLEAVDGWQPPVLPPERVQAPVPAAARRDLEPYMDLLAHQEALLAPFTQWPSKCGPRQLMPIYVDENGQSHVLVLHLFSGRRRTGDCVDWAEKFNVELEKWAQVRITMISVDTAIHPEFGNLDNGANYTLITSIAAKGIFGADLSGPPCETWSGARHLDLGHRGPRPLRSASLSWGIPYRSLRELVQVGTGSRLMLNSLYLDLIIVDQGGISLMEHPDCPWDPEFASVWRSKIHRQVIMARQFAHELHVQQWRYGADTVKPTLLRTVGVNGGQAKAALQRNVLADARYPTSTLGGKAATGEFKTAAAKEYPTHFCKLLMDLVQSHVASEIRAKRTRTVSHSLLTQAELAWLRSLTEAGSFKTKDRWLPDYQPGV